MPNPKAIRCTVFKQGTLTALARVYGWDTELVTPAAIASVTYTISKLDSTDPDAAEAVTGHTAVALDPSAVLFAALQTDDRWTLDASGFQFCHTIDASLHVPFAVAGATYRLEYVLTPTSGQAIRLRYEPGCI